MMFNLTQYKIIILNYLIEKTSRPYNAKITFTE